MLQLKPFAPVGFDLTIACDLRRAGDELRIEFILRGDIDRIRFAERKSHPSRQDELWKSTCFELFLAPRSRENYWEFNFSPSGEWNCYAFDSYRSGMRAETRAPAPEILVSSSARELRVEAVVDASEIPEFQGDLDTAVTTVIERDGEISFWAIDHQRAEPDFHWRGSFVAAI